uniref:Uncharacterized protein n=1 Tax=Rhizophora mucronata TaxID=61149 RepID=A0A2P2P2Q7_RHIMU
MLLRIGYFYHGLVESYLLESFLALSDNGPSQKFLDSRNRRMIQVPCLGIGLEYSWMTGESIKSPHLPPPPKTKRLLLAPS